MSETMFALRSVAPIIYASVGVVALLFVFQLFGFDLARRLTHFAEKFAIRDKVSDSGA